jgi:hypothetical protein
LESKWDTKYSVTNRIKYSVNSFFFTNINFDKLWLLPIIWTSQHFRRIYYLYLRCDPVQHSIHDTCKHFVLSALTAWLTTLLMTAEASVFYYVYDHSTETTQTEQFHIQFCVSVCTTLPSVITNLSTITFYPIVLSFNTFICDQPELCSACWRWSISPSSDIKLSYFCRMSVSQSAFLSVITTDKVKCLQQTALSLIWVGKF